MPTAIMKAPGIKLFGKKIELPESAKSTNLPSFSTAGDNSHGGRGDHHGLAQEKKTCSEEERVNREDAVAEKAYSSDQVKGEAKPEDELDDNPKTPIDEDTAPENPPTTRTEVKMANLQPITPKKPNNVLPCPRCDSMDTKFCYYNNCNVNQPRHFCKSCQRYWTAGGTMRSMPVGAGRRKKKNLASHCRFVTISQEAFESAAAPEIEFATGSDGVYKSVPPKVLSFGPNTPQVGVNGSLVSCRGKENRDDCSSGSSVTTMNSVAEKTQDNSGFHSQVHWIPEASWSYNPWNSALPIPIPAICPPGYPQMPFYPSPYWSSVPWLPPATLAPNFSILGKHSRDGEQIKPNGSEEEPKKQKNLVLIPKTLRIDDPDEAAKSSIWETLGIKNENISRGGLFKAFHAKGNEKKKHPATASSPVLQANPAAFSRSLCFQERA